MRKILAIAAFAFFACFYCFGADASAPAADSDATASAPAADTPAPAVAEAQASDAVPAASAAAASDSAAPAAVDANADAAADAGSEKASDALPQAASSALKGGSPAAAAPVSSVAADSAHGSTATASAPVADAPAAPAADASASNASSASADATASAPAADAPAPAVAEAQASDAVPAASAAAASDSVAPAAVDANADAAADAGSEKASDALPQAASSALKGGSPAAAAVAVDPVKSQQLSPDASHAKQSEAAAANPSSSDRWSFEQMKEYESKKLSISIINSTMQKVQYDKYELQWYSKAYEEAGGSISMQNWEPFRGGEPISKSEFVDIIGDPELLEKKLEVERRVKAKHDSGLIWGGAGLGGVLAGTVMVIVNSTLPAERKSNVLTGIGLGLIGVSLVPVGIGIYNLTYREDIDISADVALSFTNDYNIRLESEIRISFK